MAATKPTSAEIGFTQANIGIQTISGIANSIIQTNAFETQIKAQSDAAIANMDNQLTAYEYSAYKLEEDYKALDSMFADKISERSLQGMKDFATMKAAAAETGTAGGTTTEAINQAKVDEMFDVAIINSKRKASLGGILRQQETARMSAINAFESLSSGGVNVNANPILSGLAGATNALGSLLVTMPSSVSADIFGVSTTGGTASSWDYRAESYLNTDLSSTGLGD